MKPKLILPLITAALVAATAIMAFRKTALSEIPQSKRCAEMCKRRDLGSLQISPNASKDELRRSLGEPQNTDQDGEVWLWLIDWDSYERSGLPRDWRTMSSGGYDGLWIGFDAHGRIRTPLWSLSAATPPASDYRLPVDAKHTVR